MRLIDADRVLYFLENEVKRCADGRVSGLVQAHIIVDDMPTVDAEPVRHGRWEKSIATFHKKCSNCGSVLHMPRERRYCSECGAKMDAEVKG